MAGSSSSSAAHPASLDEQEANYLENLRKYVEDFETNHLPIYARRKQLLAQLTGSAPLPPPVPVTSGRRANKAATRGGSPPARNGSDKLTRKDQALRIVAEHPGISIPGIAELMGIDANYLYRVMPGLKSEGKVTQDAGKGWSLVPGALEGLAPHPDRVAELTAAGASS